MGSSNVKNPKKNQQKLIDKLNFDNTFKQLKLTPKQQIDLAFVVYLSILRDSTIANKYGFFLTTGLTPEQLGGFSKIFNKEFSAELRKSFSNIFPNDNGFIESLALYTSAGGFLFLDRLPGGQKKVTAEIFISIDKLLKVIVVLHKNLWQPTLFELDGLSKK
jgi:hypothetical protein